MPEFEDIEGEFTTDSEMVTYGTTFDSIPYVNTGYYRRFTSPEKEHEIAQKDDMVYVISHTNTQVTILHKSSYNNDISRTTMKIVDFLHHFKYQANGADIRRDEIARLMQEVQDSQFEAQKMTQQIGNYRPHLLLGANADDVTTEIDTTGIAPSEAKKTVSLAKNDMRKFQLALEQKTNAIQYYMKEQMAILQSTTGLMQDNINKFQEAIWTINLYTGGEEYVQQLREGIAAPANTKITIRQNVLYMDEECAINAYEGGMDYKNLEDFDNWILETPEHLNQILPEPKGVVALIIRRHSKNYDFDGSLRQALANIEKDKANNTTYFLIRNGENLYRICTDFSVSDVIFPKQDEFLNYFRKVDKNGEVHTIYPGDDEYMKVLESSEARKRYYMRVALILQGIIDRTTIFRPLGFSLNLCQPDDYTDKLNIVNDAEMQLSDGKLRFEEWVEHINSKITVGSRIIGSFNSWDHGLRQYVDSGEYGSGSKRTNERLTPETIHTYPDDNAIYVVEAKNKNGGYYFYYNYEKYSYGGDSLRRAKCLIYPNDDFILNFDEAEVKDMQYYLGCRMDRQHYTWMFPLLKAAIVLKEKEEKEEAPFKQLLIGEIIKKYKVDYETAIEKVGILIKWWKLKNRYHRALLSSETNALNEIVNEFNNQNKKSKLNEADNTYYKNMLLNMYPDTLLIAQNNNQYIVLTPSVEHTDVYFTEHTYKYTIKDGLTLKESKPWCVMNGRYLLWNILYKSARWDNWKINASVYEYLTTDEELTLFDKAWAEILNRKYRKDYPRETPLLIAFLQDEYGKYEIFAYLASPDITYPILSETRIAMPYMDNFEIKWQRNSNKTIEITSIRHGHTTSDNYSFDYANHIIKKYDENIEIAKKELRYVKECKTIQSAMRKFADTAYYEVTNIVQKRKEQEVFDRFIAEHGDMELWNDHVKILKQNNKYPSYVGDDKLRKILYQLVDRRISFDGLTVADAIKLAHRPTKKEEIRSDPIPSKYGEGVSYRILGHREVEYDWEVDTQLLDCVLHAPSYPNFMEAAKDTKDNMDVYW